MAGSQVDQSRKEDCWRIQKRSKMPLYVGIILFIRRLRSKFVQLHICGKLTWSTEDYTEQLDGVIHVPPGNASIPRLHVCLWSSKRCNGFAIQWLSWTNNNEGSATRSCNTGFGSKRPALSAVLYAQGSNAETKKRRKYQIRWVVHSSGSGISSIWCGLRHYALDCDERASRYTRTLQGNDR